MGNEDFFVCFTKLNCESLPKPVNLPDGILTLFCIVQHHLGLKTRAVRTVSGHIPAVLFPVMEQLQPEFFPIPGLMPEYNPEFPDAPVHQLLKGQHITHQIPIYRIVEMPVHIQMAVPHCKSLFPAFFPGHTEPAAPKGSIASSGGMVGSGWVELLRTQDLALHRVCHEPYSVDLCQQFAGAAVFLGIDPDLPVILCPTDTLRGSFHPEQIGGCGTPVNPYPGFGEQKDNPLLIQPVIRESQMFQMFSAARSITFSSQDSFILPLRSH